MSGIMGPNTYDSDRQAKLAFLEIMELLEKKYKISPEKEMLTGFFDDMYKQGKDKLEIAVKEIFTADYYDKF